MGAWGVRNFENDDALDWVSAVTETKDTKLIIAALKAIDGNDGYLEAPECCEALCAVEIIASKKSNSPDSLPEELIDWLQKPQGLFRKLPGFTEDQYALARRVLNKITSDSELKELWEESDAYPEWCTVQQNLAEMLK